MSVEDILSAALGLVRREGMHGLTMRAVAAELGVTPMAVYHYVEDKDHLLRMVVERISAGWPLLQPVADDWEAELHWFLVTLWEDLARYPGLGAYMIELPTMGVDPEKLRDGIKFFESAGFHPSVAPLAWSFALTYIHGRISVDAHLAHTPDAPRLEGLHAQDYVNYGVDAVIVGLRELRDRGN
jgi:AcrR family transcriptional regulator